VDVENAIPAPTPLQTLARRARQRKDGHVKYMIMMFGDAASMGEVQSPEWIREMIGEMIAIDADLTASGELVFQAGLADGSMAKTMRSADGGPVAVTDGPYAESKESIIGFWIVDVESDERLREIVGRIVRWSGVVEVRPLGEAPTDV
jgi:hypothetical protein